MTAPTGEEAATASIVSTAASPICGHFDVRDGQDGHERFLIVSLATRGRPSSTANGAARVNFPLAGGPETTTKTGEVTTRCWTTPLPCANRSCSVKIGLGGCAHGSLRGT